MSFLRGDGGMKRLIGRAILTAFILVSLFTFTSSCSTFAGALLKVVAGTTQISAAVRQIGGSAVSVISIIPPTQNPLTYELKPEDAEKLSGAEVLIIHDWQATKFPEDLTSRKNSTPSLKIFQVSLNGDWLLPSGQLEAAGKIAAILAEVDARRADLFHKAVTAYKEEVKYREAHIQARAVSAFASASLPSTNVVCEEHLKGFLTWMGFSVTATFGELELVADEEIDRLIEKGKTERVIMVVDSLQCSKTAVMRIAVK